MSVAAPVSATLAQKGYIVSQPSQSGFVTVTSSRDPKGVELPVGEIIKAEAVLPHVAAPGAATATSSVIADLLQEHNTANASASDRQVSF